MASQSVVFVVDPVSFERAFKSWNGSPVGTWMRAQLEQCRVAAIANAPGPGKPPFNRTGWSYGIGELETSITTSEHRSDTLSDLEGHVEAGTDHALMVHEGTVPHVIHPKRAGHLLKFPARPTNKPVYAKMVKHPGTMANPFLVRALRQTIPGVGV